MAIPEEVARVTAALAAAVAACRVGDGGGLLHLDVGVGDVVVAVVHSQVVEVCGGGRSCRGHIAEIVRVNPRLLHTVVHNGHLGKEISIKASLD